MSSCRPSLLPFYGVGITGDHTFKKQSLGRGLYLLEYY